MARKADTGNVKWRYTRRRPERTLLYQLVETHYPRFVDLLANQGRSLPDYVQREFQDFLRCGLLEHGFLRVRCSDCRAERLVAFSCKRRGFCSSCGACRMVESAALLVDEVLPHLPMRQWVLSFPFQLRFLFASRPQVMTHVLGTVYCAIETHLIQQAGCTRALAKTAGFSLHAGVVAKAHQRRKLERLCRYIARPTVATDRLALTPQGYVRYTLKTPYRDGTTHIILEPLDFIARLAALVPKPRVNLTRFHGVFAPNHRLRRHVTPAGCRRQITEANTPAQRRAAMTWAQRLKRVFKIDIETCKQCGGPVKVIARIEDPGVVKRILDHLEQRSESDLTQIPPARAPPHAVEPNGS